MLHSLNEKKYIVQIYIIIPCMRGLGLLVCEVVTIRGHGHVLFLHVTHTLSSEDAFLDSLFLQPSRYMFDEEYHPFKSCVLRKLYNPPKLYLMIS